jgi:hypothetical protein
VRQITKLEDINFNIEKVNGSIKMIGESEILTTALSNLEKEKVTFLMNLEQLKKFNKERTKA